MRKSSSLALRNPLFLTLFIKQKNQNGETHHRDSASSMHLTGIYPQGVQVTPQKL
jgi:hypothetical protein